MTWGDGRWAVWDLATLYTQYATFIDGLLLLIFFVSLADVLLGHRFQSDHRSGRLLVGVVGAGLAIASSTWLVEHQIRLADWGGLVLAFGGVAMLAPIIERLPRSSFRIALVAGMVIVAWMIQPMIELSTQWLHGLILISILVFLLGLIWRWWPAKHDPPHATADHQVTEAASGVYSIQLVKQLQMKLLNRLEQLSVDLVSEGLTLEIRQRLLQLTETERKVVTLYRKAIRQFAWERIHGSRVPSAAMQRLLLAMQHNISTFDRTLEIAIEAAEAGNLQLVEEAVNRLIKLERAACEQIRQACHTQS
jgi:hypothetical protein